MWYRQRTHADMLLAQIPFFLIGSIIGLLGDPARIWPLLAYIFTPAMLIALWAWWNALTRARFIGGTVSGRIATTAQGYARLTGRGRLRGNQALPEELRLSKYMRGLLSAVPAEIRAQMTEALEGSQTVFEPGSEVPCLWYRVFYPRHDLRSDSESRALFLIDDGSGVVCIVDPRGAEMLVKQARCIDKNGVFRGSYHGSFLRPGDQIHVLGEFFTPSPNLDTRSQNSELLDLWKADRSELLRRFDLDGNQKISAQEWALVRAAARRQVERMQRQALAAPVVHVMRKPLDGRPYLISDRSLDELATTLWIWAIVHGAVFVTAAAAIALVWLRAHGG